MTTSLNYLDYNWTIYFIRHYRYLGMFEHHCYHGPGIIIISTGTNCEATFAANKIVELHDTLLMDPNGRSFLGKVGGFFQLLGKVMLLMWAIIRSCDVVFTGWTNSTQFQDNWFIQWKLVWGKFHAAMECNSGMDNIVGVDHRPP